MRCRDLQHIQRHPQCPKNKALRRHRGQARHDRRIPFRRGRPRQFLGEPMPEKFEQRAHEVYEELFKRRNKIPDDNRRPLVPIRRPIHDRQIRRRKRRSRVCRYLRHSKIRHGRRHERDVAQNVQAKIRKVAALYCKFLCAPRISPAAFF